MKLLENKIAMVTGGTRGIGAAIVKRFIEHGATVILCGSKKETADKAVAEIRKEYPDAKVEGMFPTITDPNSVSECFEKIKSSYGRLDILVNNAGISARESIYDYNPADFEKIMDLNVNAAFFCAREAAKIMKEQGGGVIINTSSMVSLYGQPSGVGYPASKFAVNGLTKSLARELGKDNIRVNAVAPGVTNTDMVAVLPESVIAPIINQIPLHRVGQPEEVADAFVFLASDMASYITGEILSVDGAARS